MTEGEAHEVIGNLYQRIEQVPALDKHPFSAHFNRSGEEKLMVRVSAIAKTTFTLANEPFTLEADTYPERTLPQDDIQDVLQQAITVFTTNQQPNTVVPVTLNRLYYAHRIEFYIYGTGYDRPPNTPSFTFGRLIELLRQLQQRYQQPDLCTVMEGVISDGRRHLGWR